MVLVCRLHPMSRERDHLPRAYMQQAQSRSQDPNHCRWQHQCPCQIGVGTAPGAGTLTCVGMVAGSSVLPAARAWRRLRGSPPSSPVQPVAGIGSALGLPAPICAPRLLPGIERQGCSCMPCLRAGDQDSCSQRIHPVNSDKMRWQPHSASRTRALAGPATSEACVLEGQDLHQGSR